MRIISILTLLLAVSCSSTKTTCKADTDCGSSQVCNATTSACVAQTTSHCKSSDVCGSGYTCNTTSKQCACGTADHCGNGHTCVAGSCTQSCTGTGASTCTQGTQTCQSGTCQAQTATNCRTDHPCTAALNGCINGSCASRGYRRVFVSSKTYTLGSTPTASILSGATDADNKCQTLATDAKLNGKWMAWIASTQSSASNRADTRISNQSLAFKLINGNTLVAADYTSFNSKNHNAAIKLDESGNDLSTQSVLQVFTGTAANNCSNWTSTNSPNKYTYGYLTVEKPTTVNGSNLSWDTALDASQNPYDQVICNLESSRLYCVEVDQ